MVVIQVKERLSPINIPNRTQTEAVIHGQVIQYIAQCQDPEPLTGRNVFNSSNDVTETVDLTTDHPGYIF